MAAAGARGSLANVEINLDSLHDAAYVSKVRNKVASLRERLEKNSRRLKKYAAGVEFERNTK